ncbi:MAG TPA: disulfide bond formation protein B [Methylocella sp.]|jgi:disulfide bond formation protein DsbB|nr:disulfide bond formation protein B [Methylocella sp.]
MPLKSLFAVALAILAIAVSSIVGAFLFEALGYAPCELCLKERIPYYAAIPVAGLAVLFATRGPRSLSHAALCILALIFAGSAIFGAYHAGVEWGFWPGPPECFGPLDRAVSGDDFLKQLQNFKLTRCDAAALRILGLSLAGWNAVVSAGLAALAVAGARSRG